MLPRLLPFYKPGLEKGDEADGSNLCAGPPMKAQGSKHFIPETLDLTWVFPYQHAREHFVNKCPNRIRAGPCFTKSDETVVGMNAQPHQLRIFRSLHGLELCDLQFTLRWKVEPLHKERTFDSSDPSRSSNAGTPLQ
jgi:hypothetical protein